MAATSPEDRRARSAVLAKLDEYAPLDRGLSVTINLSPGRDRTMPRGTLRVCPWPEFLGEAMLPVARLERLLQTGSVETEAEQAKRAEEWTCIARPIPDLQGSQARGISPAQSCKGAPGGCRRASGAPVRGPTPGGGDCRPSGGGTGRILDRPAHDRLRSSSPLRGRGCLVSALRGPPAPVEGPVEPERGRGN